MKIKLNLESVPEVLDTSGLIGSVASRTEEVAEFIPTMVYDWIMLDYCENDSKNI